MNLVDTILISLATAAFIIGVHQSFYFGLAASYWVFMISLLIVMAIRYRKSKRKVGDKQEVSKNQKTNGEFGKKNKR